MNFSIAYVTNKVPSHEIAKLVNPDEHPVMHKYEVEIETLEQLINLLDEAKKGDERWWTNSLIVGRSEGQLYITIYDDYIE